jgi:choline dehydrogenase-like flavoprotein
MQRVKVDWRISQSEIDAVHHFALSVKEAFESAGFADVQVDRQIADRAPSATDLCWDNFHDLGTARMASGPASGVVDRDLRIFGAENGWVCGHAVFPTGGFANPTFTTMALAVRLADRLAGLSAR